MRGDDTHGVARPHIGVRADGRFDEYFQSGRSDWSSKFDICNAISPKGAQPHPNNFERQKAARFAVCPVDRRESLSFRILDALTSCSGDSIWSNLDPDFGSFAGMKDCRSVCEKTLAFTIDMRCTETPEVSRLQPWGRIHWLPLKTHSLLGTTFRGTVSEVSCAA